MTCVRCVRFQLLASVAVKEIRSCGRCDVGCAMDNVSNVDLCALGSRNSSKRNLDAGNSCSVIHASTLPTSSAAECCGANLLLYVAIHRTQ